MTKKELAALLDISGAMVTKLAKRGMPTDSLERAQRWRKRHLEPGRMKGQRFDPNQIKTPPAPAVPPTATARGGAGPGVAAPVPVPVATLKAVRAVAAAADVTLARGNPDQAAPMLAPLRELLRTLPFDAQPCMPLRVWLALVEYTLHEDAEVRNSPDVCEVLSPAAFAQMVCPDGVAMGPIWLEWACDWDGYAVNGWPECYFEE